MITKRIPMNDDCKNMDELRNEEGRVKESNIYRKKNTQGFRVM